MRWRWSWALLGGAIGAGAVAGLFAWERSRVWEARARAARQTLETHGSAVEFALRSQGAKLQTELAEDARRLATSAARAEAERVLGIEYGLTPERIASMQRLRQRLGV